MVTVGTFDISYKNFVLHHWEKLNAKEVEGTNLNSIKVSIYTKKIKKPEKCKWYKSLDQDAELYFPSITQFRVTVCANLYKHHVPLTYIKQHMTHLTEEMTEYYVRSERIVDQNISEKIYSAIYKDGAKLLGENADAFIEKVNDFLKENQLNIQKNINEVIKIAGEHYPLRAKLGGICIRCGNVIPCPTNDVSDKVLCAFDMCANHCHMYFMVDISYSKYCNHVKIIKDCLQKGFVIAAVKETNKLMYLIKNSLQPELMELKTTITNHGKDFVFNQFPQLKHIIDQYDCIYGEVTEWIKKSK